MSIPNSPRTEHLGSLLVHLPDYGVVICKSCKFAIQPSALSSHLLRHQIYRKKRQILLNQLDKLSLLSPDQVSTPSSKGQAIPYLLVTSGYRCSLPDCGHLCISQKRMSQHLREVHGGYQNANIELSSEHVYVQTFFKGNKVRYFEVRPNTIQETAKHSERPVTYQFFNLSRENQISVDSIHNATEIGSGDLEDTSLTTQHLQDLMYLHHYTTNTAPSLTRGTEPADFWIHDAPLQASTQPFLMHGIIGVAAFHQAWLSSEPDTRKTHQVAGLRHQSAGLNTFRGMIDHPTKETSTALTVFARLLGVQFCVETLFEAQARSSNPHYPPESRMSKILEFILLIRGGLDLLLNMQDLLPRDSPLILSQEALQGLGGLEIPPESLKGVTPYLVNELCERLLTTKTDSTPHEDYPYRAQNLNEVRDLVNLSLHASEVTEKQQITASWIQNIYPHTHRSTFEDLEHLRSTLLASLDPARISYHNTRSEPHPVPVPTPAPVLTCYPHIPSRIYLHLTTLPSRLLTILPTHPQPTSTDLAAFNHALAALVSSISRAHASDTVWSRWNGIESWPRMLPERFTGMIESADLLALVLVAHWCVLVRRQEAMYWHLQGQASRMLGIVMVNMDGEVRRFVEDCVLVLS